MYIYIYIHVHNDRSVLIYKSDLYRSVVIWIQFINIKTPLLLDASVHRDTVCWWPSGFNIFISSEIS